MLRPPPTAAASRPRIAADLMDPQAITRTLASTKVAHVLHVIDRNIAAVAADAIAINQIPAPTFAERERARFLIERFQTIGLAVERTPRWDVVAELGGARKGPVLLLQASLDTIFPPTVNPTARVEGKKVVGPGIGDNALGLAALLALAEVFSRAGLEPLGRVVFAATTATEGAGNVAGLKRVLKRLDGRVGWLVCLKGHDLGRLSHTTVCTRRMRIVWGAGNHRKAVEPMEFLPDLLRSLGALEGLGPGVKIDLDPIEGILSSGSHATDGIGLDLKGGNPRSFAGAERAVRGVVREVAAERGVALKTQSIGGWDETALPDDHPLVQTVLAVHQALNIRTHSSPGGAEAALALAAGIPTVVLGITHGRNRHRESEWVELEPISEGLAQVFLTALALTSTPGGRARS